MKAYIFKNRKAIALTMTAALVLVLFSGCTASSAPAELHEPVRQLSWFGKIFVMVDEGLGINNFGWSVIILTTLMRIILLPLDIKQKVSMRKQSALQPKIDAINRKYKNDKEMASRKTMELYKEEGVSMFAGCLPALIQLPLFFAFFAALRNVAGVEIFDMYTAGAEAEVQGWLWVHNIWQPDTFWSNVIPAFKDLAQYDIFKNTTLTQEVYDAAVAPLVAQFTGVKNGFFLLPLLAAGSSYLQNRIATPAPKQQASNTDQPNPMNSKMMQFMFPAMSLWICSSSNAVFSIYWLASNIIGIISYLIIDKVLTCREAKKAAAQANQEGGK